MHSLSQRAVTWEYAAAFAFARAGDSARAETLAGDLERRFPEDTSVRSSYLPTLRALRADLWFVTTDDTPKLRDLAADPHVNLSYYKDRTREWVSVSGTATITRDRQKIHEPTRPTGSCGSPTKATRGMARRTTRAWSSSVSACMRRCSSR